MKYSVNELVELVDRKFDGDWNLWRTALGEWHISAKRTEGDFAATKPTIEEALEAAISWEPLPRVPREIPKLYRELFAIVKDGAKWRVEYKSRDLGVLLKRKRDAVDYIERVVEHSSQKAREWQSQYGWTRSATEGVDFEYLR